MIERETLVFATCYQLAQLISSDWENQPEEVSDAIEALGPIDEPGETLHGISVTSGNPMQLTPSEKEPESVRNRRKALELYAVTNIFKLIMKYSDSWNTADSDVIKLEITARIADYDREYKKIVTPVAFTSDIVL